MRTGYRGSTKILYFLSDFLFTSPTLWRIGQGSNLPTPRFSFFYSFEAHLIRRHFILLFKHFLNSFIGSMKWLASGKAMGAFERRERALSLSEFRRRSAEFSSGHPWRFRVAIAGRILPSHDLSIRFTVTLFRSIEIMSPPPSSFAVSLSLSASLVSDFRGTDWIRGALFYFQRLQAREREREREKIRTVWWFSALGSLVVYCLTDWICYRSGKISRRWLAIFKMVPGSRFGGESLWKCGQHVEIKSEKRRRTATQPSTSRLRFLSDFSPRFPSRIIGSAAGSRSNFSTRRPINVPKIE